MTGKTLIKLREVTKIYHSDSVTTLAVNKVNLDIQQGEFVAVVGQSGSGKSTLLSAMGLLDRFDAGSYHLAGHDVLKLDRNQLAGLRCRQIGFVFQFFHLLGDLNVSENIALPMSLAGAPSPAIRQRCAELLEQVGLSHRAKHYPNQLSGGQQQRVAVARALVNEPPLLLVDEPTGNLDSESGEEILELLVSQYRQGTTLVIVTHDPGIAGRAGRLVRMVDGSIEELPDNLHGARVAVDTGSFAGQSPELR